MTANTSHYIKPYMLNNTTFFLLERSRSGKANFFEGDIVETKSLKEMIESRKRGAASINQQHIWPIKNGKHEIPYQIDPGNHTSKSNAEIYQ